jgi:hypothetical protein
MRAVPAALLARNALHFVKIQSISPAGDTLICRQCRLADIEGQKTSRPWPGASRLSFSHGAL